MAVVSMQKVQVVVHRSDTDALLNVLQQAGAMEFTEVDTANIASVSMEFPHAQLLPRVQHAVGFLTPYEAKRSLWRTLRDGSTTELSEAEVLNQAADTDAVAQVVGDLEALQVEYAEKTDAVRQLEEQVALLQIWKAVPVKLSELTTTSTYTKLVQESSDNQKTTKLSLMAKLAEFLEAQDIPSQITSVTASTAAVTVAKDAVVPADLHKQLEGLGLQIVAAPHGSETAEVELVATEEKLAAAKGELGLVHNQAEEFAQTHLRRLRIVGEVLSWERDRYATVGIGAATNTSVVLEGWINASKRSALEATFAQKNIAAMMSDLEPQAGEEPPVDIVNNSFIQPFEVVTRLYGMPGHKDLDPTLFLAGFFFLFFGLSLTDVGYGIFLMAVATMILTLFKVAPVVRTFAKLLLFMGLGSALVGLLFGGYLGIAPESLPSWLRAIQLFDPIGNPLPVFYLALGLGVFQVMVGMFLKIYSDARNGELMNGILDQGPWLFVFFVAIAYLGVTTGYLNIIATPDQLINLIYVGLVLVVLASGRKGKTILEKVQSAALSLYASIGYFSDILSYSRLLALGLATTALAFAVNLIAEIVSGTPVVGPVLAIVVLVIGHLFTLAVNTLGAFIHSARLQFVEFFGKFVAGTGREFKPLKRTAEHVAIADE
jgi:V/A-type H+-transporting ATPase subunit I